MVFRCNGFKVTQKTSLRYKFTSINGVKSTPIYRLQGSILGTLLPLRYLKACVCYFDQIFIFLSNDSPSKTMKNAFNFT